MICWGAKPNRINCLISQQGFQYWEDRGTPPMRIMIPINVCPIQSLMNKVIGPHPTMLSFILYMKCCLMDQNGRSGTRPSKYLATLRVLVTTGRVWQYYSLWTSKYPNVGVMITSSISIYIKSPFVRPSVRSFVCHVFLKGQ